MKQVIWFVQFLLVVLVSLPFAFLPDRISLRLGDLSGLLLFRLWRERRSIAVRNISAAMARGAIAVSETPEAVIRQHFRNLGKSFAEIVKIYFGRGEEIFRGIEILGREHYENASAKGKGVIIITGHCGNWELLALALARNRIPVNGVARAQDNPYLNKAVENIREKYGNRTIYKKGALRNILQGLKKNETIGIVIDQSVVRSEGIVIDFLSQKSYTMKMPAVLARKTGSPVLPVFIRRVSGGHVIEIGEEISLDQSVDPKAALLHDTMRFASTVEAYVRKNPAEWLWIHRKWKRFQD